MSCKCRDTDTRRCRWEFSGPETWNTQLKYERRMIERKGKARIIADARESLRPTLAELEYDDEQFELNLESAHEVDANVEDEAWEAYLAANGYDDVDEDECSCRRCAIHGDFGGCLVAEDKANVVENDPTYHAWLECGFGDLSVDEVNELGGFTVTYGRGYLTSTGGAK